MPDLDVVLTLRTEIANDVTALDRILERVRLTPEKLRTLPASDPAVPATAFEVHNYYCVSENLMRRVATAFENLLDPNLWHKQLLFRMALDIQGIRPALIDSSLRGQLDEFRKFRHFFRNAYDRQLVPGKVADILTLLQATHPTWQAAIQRFLGWLEELAERMRRPD